MITRPVHRRQWLAAGAAARALRHDRHRRRAGLRSPGHAVRRAQPEDRPDRRATRFQAAAGRIVLAMDTRAFLTPAGATDPAQASFDPNLLYQFKIDTDGDAVEDKVIQVTFSGEGASQQVSVRGPVAPPVRGAMENEVADASPGARPARSTRRSAPADGIQVFAGPRDDPFFIDLEAAFCILPDRRPVSGQLSSSCALTPSQPGTPFYFRNPGVNYVAGFNVNSIVIELPTSMIEGSAPGRLGIWGTISQ